MELENHCLFCLERVTPYNIPFSSSNPLSTSHLGEDGGQEEEEAIIPTFRGLCTYLKITWPKKEDEDGSGKKLKSESSSVLSSSCDKFLCISCVEMVELLRSLYRKLAEIQREIGKTTGKIREVIVGHDISSKLTSGNHQKRRTEFIENVGRRGRDNPGLALVEMFQSLVKAVNVGEDNEEPGRKPATISSVSAFASSSKDKPRKKRKATPKPVGEEVGEWVIDDSGVPQLKIELAEEDAMLEDPDLFTDFYNDALTTSPPPVGNEQEAKLEVGGIEDHDKEWKPEIKTRRRKLKTDGVIISSRLRKRRRILPSPAIKKPRIKKEDPLLEYKCSDCDLAFPTWRKRWEHRTKFHPRVSFSFTKLAATIPTVGRSLGNRGRICIYKCTICGQHVKERCRFKLLNYMEHMLSHDHSSPPDVAGTTYSCPDCDKQFNLKINLDLHQVCIHETRQEVIRCDLCTENFIYESGEELIHHLKSVHGDTIFSCRHCPISYISFEKLLLHMVKHKGCRKLICPECGAISTTIKELRGHCHQSHPHLKESFTCEKCDKTYLAWDPLRSHMERQHGYDPRLKTFSNLADLNLPCPHCIGDKNKGKIVYSTELALNQHIMSAHKREKTWNCEECDKCFKTKNSLEKHVEAKHRKIRFPCPHCPKTYSDEVSLNYHMKTHTGEGLLICHICSMQFPRPSQLKVHMRSHQTFEKRVCDICGKSFLGDHRLATHKKNAHAEKKYECEVCGIKMRRQENMKSHMRTHNGDRPYKCPVCDKSFNRRDILRVHVKGVHGLDLVEMEEKYEKETGEKLIKAY